MNVSSGQPGSRERRIPSLDGIRAVSIGFVLIGHLLGTRHFLQFSSFTLAALGPLGNLGVRVFFVVSGFLITGLLLDELKATGRISLRNFYIRRVFRIFPAAYLFLGILTLVSLAGWIQFHRYDLICAVTYTINYYGGRSWNVGHLWSLAVEEQFYLIWPAVLAGLGPFRSFRAAVGMFLLAPAIRMALLYSLPRGTDTGAWFLSEADALAAGCILAGFREQLWNNSRYRRFLTSNWMAVVPLIILAVNTQQGRPRVMGLAGLTILNAGIALCIDRLVRLPAGPIGRVLNSPPMVQIGILSYSLYLWQQVFLNRDSTALLCAFPQNLLLTFAAAYGSYFLVEKPFLGLRKKFRSTAG